MLSDSECTCGHLKSEHDGKKCTYATCSCSLFNTVKTKLLPVEETITDIGSEFLTKTYTIGLNKSNLSRKRQAKVPRKEIISKP